MFFWLVLSLLVHSLFKDKPLRTWVFFGVLNGIICEIFIILHEFDLIGTSITSISILISSFFIIPYIITAVFLFFYYLGKIKTSPGKYWWFFFKPVTCYKLEQRLTEEEQWLKDNLIKEDFIFHSEYIYFKNANDAVLFKLSTMMD